MSDEIYEALGTRSGVRLKLKPLIQKIVFDGLQAGLLDANVYADGCQRERIVAKIMNNLEGILELGPYNEMPHFWSTKVINDEEKLILGKL
jgi:hypothetical protein